MKADSWVERLRFKGHLAEGLHWDVTRSLLWWVDIQGHRLARWSLGDASWTEWQTPQRVGWVMTIEGSQQILLGLQQGIASVSAGDGPLVPHWICRWLETLPNMRLNDAKADGSGCIWTGEMDNDDESNSVGRLVRVDLVKRRVQAVDTGYKVPNGPAFHPNGRMMLHTDSLRRTIYAFETDAHGSVWSHRSVWLQLAEHEGFPDGMTFDSEGCLWLAHWGAGCVSRYSHDAQLIQRYRMPVTNVTNVCFGGVELDRLFVSTARAGLSVDELAQQPMAGSLFEIDAGGVRGVAAHSARV